MSDDDTINPADGGKILAAEYVLGVLSAQERREVERRLAQEPALASEVAFWEARLGGLANSVAPVEPSPATWGRIETAIAPPPRPARRPAESGRASRSGVRSRSARRQLQPPASRRWPISAWCRRPARP